MRLHNAPSMSLKLEDIVGHTGSYPPYSPGVCSGQGAMRRGSDDLERGAESVEPPRWELRGASGELQQTGQLLLGEAGHHRPEPLHHL